MKLVRSCHSRRTILIIAIIYTLLVVGLQWDVFTLTRSRADYEYRYSRSQYVLGEKKQVILGDGDIYTYAGIRYVEGEDVTRINFEHPPLVKYAYGLSYIATGIPNWAIIPFILLAVICFWEITVYLIKPKWGRFLALALFLGHSIIYKAIPQTMLDFPFTALLLAALVFHIKLIKKPSAKASFLFGLFAGFALLAKYPFPLTGLLIALLLITQIINQVSLRLIVGALGSAAATYLIGYTSFFTSGNSFIDWLKFEWWRWQWFEGKVDSPKGMIWQTIFLGRYPKWWEFTGEYVQVTHWNLLWPGLTLLYIFSWFKSLAPKPDYLLPYKLWVIIALAAYTLGVAEDRFLVPLIPGLVLYSTAFIVKVFCSRSTVR